LSGAGGFINISQNARKLIFAGTFTTSGLEVQAKAGRLCIVQEGRARKFRAAVEQITFAGRRAAALGQTVLYVTERCVFELTAQGLRLAEVAPGIDLERGRLFLDLRHLPVRRAEDIAAIRAAVETRCREIGQRVATIVNYDGFQVDHDMAEACAQMTREMQALYYSRVSRYASGAFRRMQLERMLAREETPPIFASEQQAEAWLQQAPR